MKTDWSKAIKYWQDNLARNTKIPKGYIIKSPHKENIQYLLQYINQ